MQVKLHGIPERKFLASGIAGVLAYFLMLAVNWAFGIALPFETAVPIAVALMLAFHYLVPPTLQDVLARVDGELKRRFALEELGDPRSTLDPEASSRLREGAGNAVRAVGLILLLGGLALGGPVACASYQAQQAEAASPARTLYAVQADYNAALAAAVGYAESDAADPDVVAGVARLDRLAWAALRDAQRAVRAGDGMAIAASMAIARAAVGELVAYVSGRVGGAS